MRKKIVAGNWKMNTTLSGGLALATEVTELLSKEQNVVADVVLCVPFTHLFAVGKLLEGKEKVFLGAQNAAAFVSGAFTGEVSPEMLTSVGAKYVILGHSERREKFGETNETLRKKVNLALDNGLIPIFCCGESLDTRQNEDFIGFVKHQLTESLFHLDEASFSKIIIAYEPIWAIGTGLTATPEQAQEMHLALRQHLASHYGDDVAANISILYGGSANAANAASLFAEPDVDGGLIGGASLKAADFLTVIKAAK